MSDVTSQHSQQSRSFDPTTNSGDHDGEHLNTPPDVTPTNSMSSDPSKIVRVRSPGKQHCYQLRVADIRCLRQDRVKKPILCASFSTTDSCQNGDSCNFVHATRTVLEAATRNEIHYNRSYKTLSAVPYSTYPPEVTLRVKQQGRPRETLEYPGDQVIRTTGADDLIRHIRDGEVAISGSVCGHFFANRVCLEGSSCAFLHIVTLDPDCQPGQRAAKKTLPTPYPQANAPQETNLPQGIGSLHQGQAAMTHIRPTAGNVILPEPLQFPTAFAPSLDQGKALPFFQLGSMFPQSLQPMPQMMAIAGGAPIAVFSGPMMPGPMMSGAMMPPQLFGLFPQPQFTPNGTIVPGSAFLNTTQQAVFPQPGWT